MGMPGGWEWLVVLGIVLVLFGGKKIPELAKGLGKGIRNFKEEMKEPEEKETQTDAPKKVENAQTAVNSETPKQTTSTEA